MGRWVMALTAAGVALVAATARAQLVVAKTTFVKHGLAADTVTAFTGTCPAGYAAVSAGVARPAAGTTLVSATPVGLRAYAFRFGNPAGNEARRVTVAVACRAIRAGRPLLRVRTVQRALIVRPRAARTVSLGCPAQTLAAGPSVDLDPGRRAAGAFGGAALAVRTATAGLNGFRFTIRNSGSTPRRAIVYGTCVTVVRRAASASGSLQLRITVFPELVRPGSQRVAHRCPTGWSALGAGYVSVNGVRVTGAAALVAGGRWWLENELTAATTVRLQLACARV